MSESLFDEFAPVTAKQWKQKIQFDLKGADYNSELVWTSDEDIKVKPFYHSEDLNQTFPKPSTKASNFKICETIFVDDVSISNKIALQALNSGAESLQFIIPNQDVSIELLLNNINLDNTSIYIETLFLSQEYVKQISSNKPYQKLNIKSDIINNLAKTGNWFYSLKDDFSKFETILQHTNTFSIDTALYQNAGANCIQQLAYGLAHLNEYFNHIENSIQKNITETVNVIFTVAMGSNYFFEIAKLRALRLLFETLQNEYSVNYRLSIFATASKRNKGIYDYNTNILRTTTECMSAVLGGADIINNLPYDAVFKKPNAFSSRIARNQLLVLKNESYFDMVDNPADGSYYIEDLTQQLAEKVLELFKNIETGGGFLKQLKDGTIQRKIKESARKEQEQFNNGTKTILGSNKHPNPNDIIKKDLEIYPFVKTKQRKTLIEPIIEKRLTEKLEQERLKNE
ncbi:MAG: methylmalonyl-CoA mutase subunit beta [Jejuia sp.]